MYHIFFFPPQHFSRYHTFYVRIDFSFQIVVPNNNVVILNPFFLPHHQRRMKMMLIEWISSWAKRKKKPICRLNLCCGVDENEKKQKTNDFTLWSEKKINKKNNNNNKTDGYNDECKKKLASNRPQSEIVFITVVDNLNLLIKIYIINSGDAWWHSRSETNRLRKEQLKTTVNFGQPKKGMSGKSSCARVLHVKSFTRTVNFFPHHSFHSTVNT